MVIMIDLICVNIEAVELCFSVYIINVYSHV